jgi:beta-lactamase class A
MQKKTYPMSDIQGDGVTNVLDVLELKHYLIYGDDTSTSGDSTTGNTSSGDSNGNSNSSNTTTTTPVANSTYITLNSNPQTSVVQSNGLNIYYTDTDFRMSSSDLNELTTLLNSVSYSKGFVLYDINTNAYISHNSGTYYPVASTVKAPFVLSCLQSVDRGEHTLDETMQYASKYYSGGTGVIKNTAYGTTYRLQTLMRYTITVSDNAGYYMLQDHFGYTNYNNFLASLGNRVTIDGNSIKWGKTSAMDSMRNWTQIYNYIANDNPNSELFAGWLESTTNSCIRDALGSKYTVANKMGWQYNTCCHDQAIVFANTPYILIIMTSGDAYANNQNFIKNLATKLDDIHTKYESYVGVGSNVSTLK